MKCCAKNSDSSFCFCIFEKRIVGHELWDDAAFKQVFFGIILRKNLLFRKDIQRFQWYVNIIQHTTYQIPKLL